MLKLMLICEVLDPPVCHIHIFIECPFNREGHCNGTVIKPHSCALTEKILNLLIYDILNEKNKVWHFDGYRNYHKRTV